MATTPSSPSQNHEIARLNRAIQELTVLNDLAQAISASLDTDEIMNTICNRAARAVGAEQVVVTLVDRQNKELRGTIVREIQHPDDEPFHVTQELLGCLCHENRPLLINDPATDSRLRGVTLAGSIRNLLCVPLAVESQLMGVLSAYNKVDADGFDAEDQRLLAIMGSQSAQVLERSRLVAEEKANAELREEMRMAERIQSRLLPHRSPQIEGYELAGATYSALQVGGDYYDFIELRDKKWALTLGDVSGKGLPAALLMANLQATLRGQAHQAMSCHRTIEWCNRLLFASTPPEKFATLFYAELDTRSHVLTYCNAGHERPFLIAADGTSSRLITGGLAVGVIDEFEFEDDIVRLRRGDLLVVFSDGVTDMVNGDDSPFGEDRLQEILATQRQAPVTELVAAIIAAVQAHAGDEPPFDDLTVLAMRRSD